MHLTSIATGIELPSGQHIVEFRSRYPHQTRWLHTEFREEDGLPDGLVAALAEVGWMESSSAPAPQGGVAARTFEKPGSGLSSEWTNAQRGSFVDEARSVLRRFGFDSVSHYMLPREG